MTPGGVTRRPGEVRETGGGREQRTRDGRKNLDRVPPTTRPSSFPPPTRTSQANSTQSLSKH
jgi:hypothetical protein